MVAGRRSHIRSLSLWETEFMDLIFWPGSVSAPKSTRFFHPTERTMKFGPTRALPPGQRIPMLRGGGTPPAQATLSRITQAFLQEANHTHYGDVSEVTGSLEKDSPPNRCNAANTAQRLNVLSLKRWPIARCSHRVRIFRVNKLSLAGGRPEQRK